MLISILSVPVEPLEISCAEAANALAPQADHLKSDELMGPLCLMFVFKK